MHVRVVILAEVAYACRLADGMVFACHVVGDKVHDDLHSSLVGTLYEVLPLSHAQTYVLCQVGVYVVIIGDGIRRTRFAFYHLGVLCRNTV